MLTPFAPDSGPQYGTVERAWMALMTEAEKVSDLHLEVKNRLVIDDFEKVKNWQKDSYHKQMMGGFKETKEAEEGFKRAQKPWAKKLKEVSMCMRACCVIHCDNFFKDILMVFKSNFTLIRSRNELVMLQFLSRKLLRLKKYPVSLTSL